MKLEDGQMAPLFEGLDQDGNKISSADFSGKYFLLYFYPKDNTSGCTKEACGFRDNYGDLKKVVDIVGVSGDNQASHIKFKEKYNLPFPLIADTERKVIGAFGADGLIFPKRVSFLIGPDGKIIKIYSNVDPSKHADQVKADIVALNG